VRGDFDDVVGRVGMGLGKKSDDHLVDAGGTSGRWEPGVRFDQLAMDGLAGLQWMLQPEHGSSNGACFGSSKADDSNAATSRWGSDGDDGVIEIHTMILAVTKKYLSHNLIFGVRERVGIQRDCQQDLGSSQSVVRGAGTFPVSRNPSPTALTRLASSGEQTHNLIVIMLPMPGNVHGAGMKLYELI
jgi:hypothetical protein